MRKWIQMFLLFFTIIFMSSSTSFASPVISILVGGMDSANTTQIVLPTSGEFDVSLLVSGINSDDTRIFELQFDLVLPDPLSWTGSPTYHVAPDAVNGWVVTMGGILSSNSHIYREFSAEFLRGANPLKNGTLVSGLSILVPDGTLPGLYNLAFENIKGTNSDTIEFKGVGLNAVPIPATALLFLSGILGLVGVRRKLFR